MGNAKIDKLMAQWRALQPLSSKDANRLKRRFDVDFNYNSNHIEGNTLTYGQTESLILLGKVIGEADAKDVFEMKASQLAVQMVEQECADRALPLTQNFIRNLHRALLREDYEVHRNLPGGITTSYTIHAGQYKTRPNSVITRDGERFEYASVEDTPSMMADLVDWYNAEEQKGRLTPVELAALFHYRYIRIHPFEDGNGRIARLMVNYILARHGYPMTVVRSRNKSEYLDALHHTDLFVGPLPADGARASLSEITPFLRYFNGLIINEMTAEIQFLTERDEDVWWFDGQRIKFRTPSYSKILVAMQSSPTLSITEMSRIAGISAQSVQKLVDRMLANGYIGKGSREHSWRVFITK